MTKTFRIDPARLAFLDKRSSDARGVVHAAYEKLTTLNQERRQLRDPISQLEWSQQAWNRPDTRNQASEKKSAIEEARARLAKIIPLTESAQASYEAESAKATAASELLERCRQYAFGGSRS